MASAQPPLNGVSGPLLQGPVGWKRRLEDPLNTHYRYPLALHVTRLLLRTRVTPNQVSLSQPPLAAVAGYLVARGDAPSLIAAAVVFELRSVLDCVDGTLARARRAASPDGHAIDAMADWLSVALLFAGVAVHLHGHPPPGWSGAATLGVVALSLAQGALRSFAFDYFKTKYIGIYERGADSGVDALRQRARTIGEDASRLGRVELFILRFGHRVFELERFDPDRTRPLSREAIDRMVADGDGPRARGIAFLWSVSSGDAFLSFVVASLLLGAVWEVQLFFATVGFVWIVAVVLLNVRFVRRYRALAGAG